jgi:hypothetical protein
MSRIFDLVRAQPVFAMGIIQAGLGLGLAFGLHVTVEQISAILTFSAALLAFLLQRVVTPIAAPTLQAGTVVSVQGTEDKTIVGAP